MSVCPVCVFVLVCVFVYVCVCVCACVCGWVGLCLLQYWLAILKDEENTHIKQFRHIYWMSR